jgi:hypothetical protein
MNHRFAKIFIVMTVLFVLLYYSVAWAVLRCSHDEGRVDREVALYNSASDLLPVHVDLQCVHPDYHTEAMAESSPFSRFHLTPEIVPHANGILASIAATAAVPNNLWLRAFPPFTFPSGVPRHLSLSVFRI